MNTIITIADVILLAALALGAAYTLFSVLYVIWRTYHKAIHLLSYLRRKVGRKGVALSVAGSLESQTSTEI